MAEKTYSAEFAGKPLTVKLGTLAQQASGSVVVQYGETTVLATAVLGNVTERDYFPLMVDYEEKYYAAGKIKGSKWIKREGRPSEEAILTGRVIDRSIRPRFDQRGRNEVQCVATVLSFDGVNDPDMPALFAVSTALMVSNIPYGGPVSAVRVGRVGGKFLINPTYKERQEGELDIIVSGTPDRINMIEAGANIVSEDIMGDAIEEGFKALQALNELQKKIASEHGTEKTELAMSETNGEFIKEVHAFCEPKLEDAIFTPSKKEHYEGQARVKDELMGHLAEKYKDSADLSSLLKKAEHYFEESIDRVVHRNALEKDRRVDGRKMDELRPLSAEVATIPHTHGNGLFQRGETQALSVLTLAAPGLEQWIETMEIDLTKKGFIHHYNFPPYSVGETGRLGGSGRREIGHGALAERALIPIIPSREAFPYTIRIVSEILGSNGSSSMASVCGSTLALMDGGVPIASPAAGIAMGIMMDESGKNYKILTDIQGPEDHHGDMDLKVAGTKDGVTAMQMDVKVEGITPQIVRETLVQARKARLEILQTLAGALAGPRGELSPHAPRVHIMKINPDKIGAVIGSGGKTINGIIEETGATIDIEDDGTVFITCADADGMSRAVKRIEQLTYEPSPGDEFDGTVVRLMDFGAFVQITPDLDGMVHVSQIAAERVERPSDRLKVGQPVHVWVREIDEKGRINLTMLPPGTGRAPRPSGENGGRRDRRP
ncbi:MAG TPA: polyribonucleotide nucleotidyltransferase [Candidatus Paceibacterota bacterium]|nr:polyribonucleotide nucleotidyltransferase [Candidatus Paceibacterota bacterium]